VSPPTCLQQASWIDMMRLAITGGISSDELWRLRPTECPALVQADVSKASHYPLPAPQALHRQPVCAEAASLYSIGPVIGLQCLCSCVCHRQLDTCSVCCFCNRRQGQCVKLMMKINNIPLSLPVSVRNDGVVRLGEGLGELCSVEARPAKKQCTDRTKVQACL
jgi:hypothetical protein